MNNNKIIIAGGSGFLGSSLASSFGDTNTVIILTRRNKSGKLPAGPIYRATVPEEPGVWYLPWDGHRLEKQWTQAIDGSDLLINLAGKSVNCRYDRDSRRAILSSRLRTTRALGMAIAQCTHPPKLWVNASSATIYCDTYGKANDEYAGEISLRKRDNMPYTIADAVRRSWRKWMARTISGPGSRLYLSQDMDFSVRVCQSWEHVFFAQPTLQTRKVALRMAIVLGSQGAMEPLLRICRYGLGGRQGHGRQYFSWVHVADLAAMIEWLLYNPGASGIYNCAAPEPVPNAELMRTLRKLSGARWGLPAPACLLEAGAWLVGTETELLLKSRKVIPARALAEGFRFRYPRIEAALSDLLAVHQWR